MKRYLFAELPEIPAVLCPCGQTHRAFTDDPAKIASIHLVDVRCDSKVHYHRKLSEIYLILEGEGYLELDGEKIPVKPYSAIMIKPGCRHRAVGKMKLVNIPIPAYDPADEWFDEEK